MGELKELSLDMIARLPSGQVELNGLPCMVSFLAPVHFDTDRRTTAAREAICEYKNMPTETNAFLANYDMRSQGDYMYIAVQYFRLKE